MPTSGYCGKKNSGTQRARTSSLWITDICFPTELCREIYRVEFKFYLYCLYKEVYLQIFKRVSFCLHSCCGEWEGGPVNQVNHTSWVAVVTPTDRPKSVRIRYVIELFCGVVCVVTLPFWHFCWCWGFCQRTKSDLFLFFLYIVIRSLKLYS